MGTLGAALQQAGISPALAELRVALSKFINQGGTCAQLRAEVDAIERMSGMGLPLDASDGQLEFAQTRQPVEGGVAVSDLPQGQVCNAPSPSSNRGGEGQKSIVGDDLQPRALPVREPSRTERGLSSIKLVQSTIQKGLLELRKTADGKAWGSVCWHELEGMDRDGAIARLIKADVNPPKNQHAELRSFLSNKQFEEICNAAKKQNDFV